MNGSKSILPHPVHWDAVVVAGKSHGRSIGRTGRGAQMSAELKFKRHATIEIHEIHDVAGDVAIEKYLLLCSLYTLLVRYLKNDLGTT